MKLPAVVRAPRGDWCRERLARTAHGEAARRLNISQPSLTKQIRRLEDLLGAPLFRRGRHGTELTAFGQRFLDEVQPVLRHVGTVWKKGREAARGARGNLAIGFTFSGIEAMSRILAAFQGCYPEVDLLFDDVPSDVQITRVAEGSLDVGFARMTIGADLAHRRIATDRLSLVYPARLGETVYDGSLNEWKANPRLPLELGPERPAGDRPTG